MFNKIAQFYEKNIRRRNVGISELYQSEELKDSDQKWGTKSFLNANEISLYTNRAIAKRAEKVGQTEFVLKNEKGEEVNDKNGILDLLENPNPLQSGFEFFELYQKYKDLTGTVYILLEGEKEDLTTPTKVTTMWLLPPHMVKEKWQDGEIVGYRYSTGKNAVDYDPSRIIASKYHDPKNPAQGMSLLKAGSYIIDTEVQLNQYQANLLRNGGKIDGVFSFDANLTKQQLQEVKAEYEEKYAEAKKSGMPLFMGGNAKYERVGSSPEELSYLESKKATFNDICIMTGVPKVLLAMFDDVKYDNAQSSIRMFLKETIKPLVDNLIFKLNQNGYITQDGYLDYKEMVPEDIERILKENDSGIKNAYLTPNEARANLGYDPIEGGDELPTPKNSNKKQ